MCTQGSHLLVSFMVSSIQLSRLPGSQIESLLQACFPTTVAIYVNSLFSAPNSLKQELLLPDFTFWPPALTAVEFMSVHTLIQPSSLKLFLEWVTPSALITLVCPVCFTAPSSLVHTSVEVAFPIPHSDWPDILKNGIFRRDVHSLWGKP